MKPTTIRVPVEIRAEPRPCSPLSRAVAFMLGAALTALCWAAFEAYARGGRARHEIAPAQESTSQTDWSAIALRPGRCGGVWPLAEIRKKN